MSSPKEIKVLNEYANRAGASLFVSVTLLIVDLIIILTDWLEPPQGLGSFETALLLALGSIAFALISAGHFIAVSIMAVGFGLRDTIKNK